MMRGMEHVSIPLSDAHQAFLEEQVGEDGSIADYVAALIDADARAKAQARLEALLQEGLDSEPLDWTPELMERIKRDAGLRA
jgi:antitoxin ParD1/3/4